jgi:hypothetical protein
MKPNPDLDNLIADIKKLQVNIMTVSRSPQYIHQTLASLFASDPLVHELSPIHLFVGSDDASYLRIYHHHHQIKVIPMTESEAQPMKEWPIWRRACLNYFRCLSAPLDGKLGVVVLEDDVVVRDRFLERLFLSINELRAHKLESYCLALYASYDFENDASFYRGEYYCSYGYPFYATPGMYYPARVSKELGEFVKKHGVDSSEDPYDLLVKRLYGDRMYSCCRALIQHIGMQSTGLGGAGLTPSFDRPFRPIPREDWGKKI